jgi:hypothetical protein
MPGPIRKPLAHPAHATMITPAAIELFARGKRIIASGKEEERASELNEICYQLEVELKMRPWMTAPLDTLGFSKPQEWEDASDWWRSAGVCDELEAALKAKRKAERAARRTKPAA